MKLLHIDVSEGLSSAKLDQLLEELRQLADAAGVVVRHRFVLCALMEEVATNIMEHAAAQWLEVSLQVDQGRPTLLVVDNGKPFDTGEAIVALAGATSNQANPADQRRLGLVMLRELSQSIVYERDPQDLNRLTVVLRPAMEEC